MSKPAPPSPPTPTPSTPRSHSISNLRTSLTALVIYHHTAICYGGYGSGPFISNHAPIASSPALIGLNLVNQSFFMASFMHMSGYHSARTLERKPVASFIKDRLFRLGLPSLLSTLFIHPVSYAVAARARGQAFGTRELWKYWTTVRGARGPVWFTATLLVFDMGLACWKHLVPDPWKHLMHDRFLPRQNSSKTIPNPQSTPLISSLLLLSTLDLLLRTLLPISSPYSSFIPLGLTLGYLPQYLTSYTLGATSISLLCAIPSAASASILLTISLASSSHLTHLVRCTPSFPAAYTQMMGGFNQLAATYSIWSNFTGYLIGTGLLSVFSRYFNRSWGRLNDLAYTAFLVHMPISTLVEAMVEGWRGDQVVKFAVVGTANVVGSWGCAFVIDALQELGRNVWMSGRI